jgi:hypothetical protein
MTQYVCDVCKKVSEEPLILLRIPPLNTDWKHETIINIDVCDDCLVKVRDYVTPSSYSCLCKSLNQ